MMPSSSSRRSRFRSVSNAILLEGCVDFAVRAPFFFVLAPIPRFWNSVFQPRAPNYTPGMPGVSVQSAGDALIGGARWQCFAGPAMPYKTSNALQERC